jgi:hypothetical protein
MDQYISVSTRPLSYTPDEWATALISAQYAVDKLIELIENSS